MKITLHSMSGTCLKVCMAAFACWILGMMLSFRAISQVRTEGTKTIVENMAEFDKIVHDFGDVMTKSGALTCSFKITNVSDKPIVIYNVASSCGCTDVSWTRSPLKPGESGKITATYTNDEGPYPFDKTLTVYVSEMRKPVILRLRGRAYDKKIALGDLYPVHFGNFALKSNEYKLGNIDQGSQRSDVVNVANLGSSPIKITFSNVTPGLEISVSPNPVPAKSLAKMTYTVTSSEDKWGKNWYMAEPRVDGRPVGSGKTGEKVSAGQIGIWAFTKEDFTLWTDKQKADGALPRFHTSTFSCGKVKSGTVVKAVFPYTNLGKSVFRIYSADAEDSHLKTLPFTETAAGKEGSFEMELNTSGMSKGTFDIVVVLTTNSPDRPFVSLFVSGTIL